jgi:Hint domain
MPRHCLSSRDNDNRMPQPCQNYVEIRVPIGRQKHIAAIPLNRQDNIMFMQDFSRQAAATATAVFPHQRQVAPVTTGLIAGTLVETKSGWQPVETLTIGDAVQTLDGGLARILGLDRRSLRPEPETTPLLIPGGSFDAYIDVLILPGQHLLLDTLDDTATDAPFAMIPAVALHGRAGVTRRTTTDTLQIITPLFADEEVVYANSGVLLHCPGITDGANSFPETSFFARLDPACARAFLTRRAGRLAA